MPHPKHALQTLWPFAKIKQSINSCMWAVILAIVGKNLDKLDFDRIQTCASQILVGRCYKPTRNPHVRSSGNFWEFSFHVETVSFNFIWPTDENQVKFSWVLQPVVKEDSQLLRAQNLIFGTVNFLLTMGRSWSILVDSRNILLTHLMSPNPSLQFISSQFCVAPTLY